MEEVQNAIKARHERLLLKQQTLMGSTHAENELFKSEVANEGEIRTWSDGRKYVKKNGQWELVSGGKKKKMAPENGKSRTSQADVNQDQPTVATFELAHLSRVKKALKSNDLETASTIANSLSDEAKNIIPQKEWEKIHEFTDTQEKKKDIPDNEMFQTRTKQEMFDLTKAVDVIDDLLKGGGFKLQGTIDYQGLHIKVENRKGTNDKGVEWKTKMIYPYGYISRTKASDDEHVDCYVGDDRDSEKVFVVHQVVPETGEYDEDKVMLGFTSKQEAKKAYLDHYDSPKFFGTMTEMTFERFKESLKENKGSKLQKGLD